MGNLIDLIKSADDLDSLIVDSIDEVYGLLAIKEKKVLLDTIEVGYFSKNEFTLTMKIKEQTEALILEKLFPKMILGTYVTTIKTFTPKNEIKEIEQLVVFNLSDKVKRLESLGVAKTIEVVLTRVQKNQYKLEPIFALADESDSEILSSYLDNKYIFYFDSETSGLNPKEHQMLEFYGKVTIDGELMEEISFGLLVDKTSKIEKVALEKNNIDPYSEEWVKNAISQEQAARKLVEFLDPYFKKGQVIFCAYRASFDYSFLSSLLIKAGLSDRVHFSGIFDPLELARSLTESKKLKTRVKENGKMCHTLSSVAEALNVRVQGDLHRAKTDVLVLEEVSKKLRVFV
jgi:DNA polymerase III epsilon subunit-like protein